MSGTTTDSCALDNPSGEASPSVFIFQDSGLYQSNLARLLGQGHCEVTEILPNADLPGDLLTLETTPDLFIFPLRSRGSECLERIGKVNSHEQFQDLPILAVADLRDLSIDIEDLRALGVVGVVDRRAKIDHIMFRINQLVRPSAQRRRWERLDSFFPVTLDADGTLSKEVALNISLGGISVRSARELEVNTYVSVSFKIEAENAELKLEGRVVRSNSDPKTVPAYRLGIVFFPLDDPTTELLDRELLRFRARCMIGDLGLVDSESASES